jgi:pilus assembly protein CpaF
MFTILIQEKGGEQRRMVFNKPEVTIGRVQGNDIVLPKGNVSKRHARIVLKDGKFIIVDLKSTNGTYVNGRKITSPLVVKDSDKIYIGDFIVGVDESVSGDSDGASSETGTTPPGERGASAPNRPPPPTEAVALPPPSVPVGSGNLGNPPNAPPGTMSPMGASPMGAGPMGAGPMGAGPMGPMGASGPMGGPMPDERPQAPPAPSPSPPRPSPPRPAPPVRDLLPRDPAPPSLREVQPPREIPMPSIAAPPSDSRRPLIAGRPGGTMPPPLHPIPPAPIGGVPSLPGAENPLPTPVMTQPMPRPEGSGGPPMSGGGALAPLSPRSEANGPSASPAMVPGGHGAQGQAQAMMSPGGAISALSVGAPASVVPMPVDKKRGLAGVGARRVVGRSVSQPSRRGVHLEPLDPKVVKMLDLQSNILERLRAKLDLDKIPIERLHEEDLWQRAERATVDLVETLETSGELPKYIDQDTLIKEALNEALALGPLEDLLADDQVDEIIIDRRDRVVVGKAGVLRGSGKAFSSDEVFERVVKRLVAEAGATIDEAVPLVDLRMRDGTRLTAAVSPVAARGACLVLKKPASQMPVLADLVAQNALSTGMADFLATCVTARRNILVCGAAGSGKTTLVSALAQASPAGERVVSIEDIAELALKRDEWIQLETRAGTGGIPEIDLGHLLEVALRMAPDRLVVGEVRGREALPLVQALCAAIDGALVAMTGEGAAVALGRLAMLSRLSAPGADAAVRELVAQAFEIVIHVARWSDGTVRVLSIEEVVGCTDTTFETHVLFQFSGGAFVATGMVPRFYDELAARGIPADQAVFH